MNDIMVLKKYQGIGVGLLIGMPGYIFYAIFFVIRWLFNKPSDVESKRKFFTGVTLGSIISILIYAGIITLPSPISGLLYLLVMIVSINIIVSNSKKIKKLQKQNTISLY